MPDTSGKGWNARNGSVSAVGSIDAMPRQTYTACPPDVSLDDVKSTVGTVMDTDVELGKSEGCETIPGCSGYSSMVHSKKVIKHALRQQAKRRRKNTTIASGNSRTLPRIVVKPLPPPPPNDPPSPVNNVQHINIGNCDRAMCLLSFFFKYSCFACIGLEEAEAKIE